MAILNYGPVLITKGKHKGCIGYYDDKDDYSKLYIYYNIPICCRNYYKVKETSATSIIPTECLAKRCSQLDDMLYSFGCGNPNLYMDKEIINILQERIFCMDMLTNRYLYSMQKMSEKTKENIFISHSTKDLSFSRCIATDLMDAGFSVFLDDWSINIGDRIFEKINNGLDNSTALIMIISQDYLLSVCCKDEWSAFYNRALHDANCHIYPIIIDDSCPPTILSQIKYLRIADDEYSDALFQLIQALKHQFDHS